MGSFNKIAVLVLSAASVVLLQFWVYFSPNSTSSSPDLSTTFTPAYMLKFHEWMSLLESTMPSRLDHVLKSDLGYHTTPPFPHTALDNLFPRKLMEEITHEFPEDPNFQPASDCVEGGKCYRDKNQLGKSELSSFTSYGPATQALFAYMKTPAFIKFLEELTGIHGIIADEQHMGSGLHQSIEGGLLGVHSDFNKHKVTGLHRRVNIFVFFNPDWEDSYEGHLELWPRDLSVCQARILPVLGRFAVFSSTDFSYHGHPHPLTCPPHRSRRSLALYYYTQSRPSSECIDGDCDGERRTTNFVTPKCHCGEPGCGENLDTNDVFDAGFD